MQNKAEKNYYWFFLLLFFGYFLYFFQGIAAVDFLYWDEPYYINAARQYLTGIQPYSNPEHPPLAKEFMGIAMQLLGDKPAGWRLSSVLFGATLSTLISFFVFRITRRLGVAAFVAFLLLWDPLLLVNSRMALLEAPLAFWLLLSTYFAYEILQTKKVRTRLIYLLGISLGCALATKLLTVIFLPLIILFVLVHFYQKKLFKQYWWQLLLSFGFVIPLIFFSSYWVIGYSTQEVFELLPFLVEYHRFHRGPSMFFSQWYEWFYIKNPIWYFLIPAAKNQLQGILLTGNLVLWIGALLAAIYAGITQFKNRGILLIATLLLGQFALYYTKPSTYLYYMAQVLPFLYVLMGASIGEIFNRWERNYRKILQIDLALFAIGVLIVFFNYRPFLWGKPFSRSAYTQGGAVVLSKSKSPQSTTPSNETQAQPETQKTKD